jgi:hypothetical protein
VPVVTTALKICSFADCCALRERVDDWARRIMKGEGRFMHNIYILVCSFCFMIASIEPGSSLDFMGGFDILYCIFIVDFLS